MNLHEILGVAWEGVTNNKMRALLTMLGVIIGVAAVIVMMSVSAGTEATISEQINSLGANLIFVQGSFSRGVPGGGGNEVNLTYDDALAIGEEIETAVGYSVEMNSSQTVKYDSTSLEGISVLGTTSDFPSVRQVEVADGRFFNQTDLDRETKVAVLAPTLAKELFGDKDPIGEKITVGDTKLTVIGLMEEKGTVSGEDWDSRLYIPITTLFDKFIPTRFAAMIGNRVRMVYVQAASPEVIEDTITQIELLLAKRHNVSVSDGYFVAQTQQDIIDTQESTTAAFRSLLAWVASVSLVVGGIGIMNIMLVSVTERTREIGIRQSMGATENDIRWQFLTEALMLSLVGGLLGVLVGVGGSWVFGNVGDMRTVLVPMSISLAFGSSALVGIFFGYYPANKAAQLDPIDALRHE